MRMNLGQWMEKHDLPNVPGAERFILGQALTAEEAECIRRMLKRAYLDSEGLNGLPDLTDFCFPYNLPFLSLLLNLIRDGCLVACADPWKDPLCYTMTSDDLLVVKGILAQKK